MCFRIGFLCLGWLLIFEAPSLASSWEKVETASDDLSLIEATTAFALEADEVALANAIQAVSEWPESKRLTVLPLLMMAAGELPPDRALAMWRNTAEPARDQAVTYNFFRIFAANHGERALDAVKTMNFEGNQASTAKTAILVGQSQVNPEMAWKWLTQEGWEDEFGVRHLIAELAKQNGGEAMTRMKVFEPIEKREEAELLVLGIWFEQDWERAVDWVKQQRRPEFRHKAGRYLLRLAGKDGLEQFERVATAMERFLDPEQLEELRQTFMRRMPIDELLSRVESHGWQAMPPERFSEAIEEVLSGSPESASRQLSAIPASMITKAERAQAVVSDWTLIDPKAARTWAESLPKDRHQEAAVLRVSSMLMEVDPALAIQQYAATEGSLREKMGRNIAMAYRQKDMAAAFEWVASLPAGPEFMLALEGVMHNADDFDLSAVASGLEKLPANSGVREAYQEFVRSFSQEDPLQAMEWAMRQPKANGLRAELVKSASRQLTKNQPLVAVNLASQLDDPTRSDLIKAVVNDSRGANPSLLPAVHEAIKQMPDNQNRKDLQEHLANRLAKHDPALAMSWMETGQFGKPSVALKMELVEGWSIKEPQAAAEWLKHELSKGQLKGLEVGVAVSNVARNWAEHDPDAVLAWSEHLSGRLRKGAVICVAGSIASYDPVRAWNLASGQSDRVHHLASIANYYYKAMPARALQAIRESSLPDKTKTELLEKFE